jgi:hypothetical protein
VKALTSRAKGPSSHRAEVAKGEEMDALTLVETTCMMLMRMSLLMHFVLFVRLGRHQSIM